MFNKLLKAKEIKNTHKKTHKKRKKKQNKYQEIIFRFKSFLHYLCNNYSLKRKAKVMNKRESIIMEMKPYKVIKNRQTIGKF